VLVGTERHLHAEEIAAETVNAARHAGLDTVAALLLTGIGGGIHCTVEVTVEAAGRVDVTVEVVTLRVWFCQLALVCHYAVFANSHFDCDCRRRPIAG
jgi:hypothetical protein